MIVASVLIGVARVARFLILILIAASAGGGECPERSNVFCRSGHTCLLGAAMSQSSVDEGRGGNNAVQRGCA